MSEHPMVVEKNMSDQPSANTDRELWRGPDDGCGDYYADSIHVTAQGSIGINVGGHVIVRPLREWHTIASELARLNGEVGRLQAIVDRLCKTADGVPITSDDTLVYAWMSLRGDLWATPWRGIPEFWRPFAYSTVEAAKADEVEARKRIKDAMAHHGKSITTYSTKGAADGN